MKWLYNNKEWDTSKFPKEGSAECAISDILWYNGYFYDKDKGELEDNFCDRLKALLRKAKQDNAYSLSLDTVEKEIPGISKWDSELHCLWMLFVGMFGEWGTSIRSGWIEREHFQDMIDFLDICEASICGYGVEEN